ncbi:hypothetical protein VB716_00145 [Synechococcus sp. CCY9201]|jgi:hypothetical protein|uniref:hypothetical protein n=1 Tax=unclassified Synechococcus TaxID=2626047 RepID=UPI0018CD2B14|nr:MULTISPECIES: hypothetical protein [unclassified Synechococcus]MEA5421901.1 hypothetical protein [Synechococcus sp. CCY9202]MEA5472632.1 hypothetical protein [Synechococcus sp. CCY9201]QPN60661.1 hypothetical protein H8F24_04485 [Synechococcus sp. CBW1002]QPN67638.1 hypothetical protein H8F26_05565 [Synechococcus sp. CBW1006]
MVAENRKMIETSSAAKQFYPNDLEPYQSAYLHGGKAKEQWCIQQVSIDGEILQAMVDILNPFSSSTDPGGFHLSVFSSQEFCAELSLFWLFKKLELPCKAQEAWMRECRCSLRRPIRSRQNIRVDMKCKSFRVIGGMAYIHARFTVRDSGDGLFLLEQRGGFRC